ncbi:MAG: PEGA domain-containing protein [Aureliella sp.]
MSINAKVDRCQTWPPRNPAPKLILLILLLLVAASGCVRRRLIVRSNPPGASVYVDKQLIGSTPAASPFTYYGTREIEVVSDGFRTEKVLRKISPPWYQIPPLDFFSETLWPWEIRDERIFDITLLPEQPLSSETLIARADNFRLQSAQGIATPLPEPFQPQNIPQDIPYVPAEPVLPPSGSGFDNPPPTTAGHSWVPGQLLRNLIVPGGQLPSRIPEAGILQGGGYRPAM